MPDTSVETRPTAAADSAAADSSAEILTIDEAAALLRIPPNRAKRLAMNGQLPGVFRVGREYRVNRELMVAGQMVAASGAVEDRLLTLTEVASLLRVSTSTAKRMAREGRMPGALPRLGGPWRFNERQVREWMNGCSADEAQGAAETAAESKAEAKKAR